MRLLTADARGRVQEILADEVERYGMTWVSARVGSDEGGLRRIKDGAYTTLTFDAADRIVTRLRGPELWHSDPVLASYYE